MFIKKLTLHKCVRIPFINGDTLTITPTRKLQVILGTNGSGKSSLMEVGFNLWPSNSNDFEREGYRELDVQDGPNVYRLRDDYSGKSPSYSFDLITDNGYTPLNSGGTRTEQVRLIQEYFNLDQDIRNVLLGKEELTSMSPARRRYWVTRLSQSDFTFAIDFFTRTQRMHRAKLAVLKHQRERIVQEQGKVLGANDLKRINARLARISSTLDTLYNNKVPRPDNTRGVDDYHRELTSISARIHEAVDSIRSTRIKAPATVFKAVSNGSTVDELLAQLTATASAVEGQCAAIGTQYNELSSKVGSIRENMTVDVGALQSNVASLSQRVQELQSTLTHRNLSTMDLDAAMRTLDSFSSLSQHHIEMYLDQRSGSLSQRIESCESTLGQIRDTIGSRSQSLRDVEHRIQHITNSDRTQCPSCSHVFIPNSTIDESDLPALESTRLKLLGELESLHERQRSTQGELESAATHRSEANSVHSVLSSNTELYPMWDRLLQTPETVFIEVNRLKQDVRTTMALIPLEQELRECKEYLAIVIADQDQSGAELVKYFDTLADTYTDLQQQHQSARNTLSTVQRYRNELVKRNARIDEAKQLLDSLHSVYDDLVRTVYADEQSAVIGRHVAESNALTQSISSNNNHQYNIDTLETDIKELAHIEGTLKLLIDTLSPKDGLIAERMTADIGSLVLRLNKAIESVWGYKMYVKPCISNKGNLDYKFPLVVDTPKGARERSDIADGSSAQISIINQAFRFLVYRRLGLQGHPLYLDELGANFDEVHRKNLIDTLGDVFEDPTYGQVFLISHYVESAMGSTLGEFIVTDDRNITVPVTYNDHVAVH